MAPDPKPTTAFPEAIRLCYLPDLFPRAIFVGSLAATIDRHAADNQPPQHEARVLFHVDLSRPIALRDHAATATIPVIMITDKAQPAEVEDYYRAGAIGVIIKPSDPMLLPREIQRILDTK